MALPLESVPNMSEGRDEATLAALSDAFGSPARLLDVHADWDHHRSVFTLVGSGEELVETLLAGIAAAAERIDLREHEGAHPRIGAADVVPLVPLEPGAEPAARGAALARDRGCGSCHLPDYRGQKHVPRLDNQPEDYLLAAMKAYRDNTRAGSDTSMNAALYQVGDDDLRALAHFLAHQTR